MAKSVRAKVNPLALKWPRELRGMPLEVAAEKLGISPERLRAYEDPNSGERPTVRQLRQIAELYRKPTAFFYLDELPEKPQFPHDYRLSMEVVIRSPHEILEAVLEARQRRQDALELSALLGEELRDFPVYVGDRRPDPSELGREIRQALGVTLEEQASWRGDFYKALREWSDAIERAGVLVFQFSRVDVSDGLGFSLPARPLPVVSLNGSDPWPQRKTFTLMHELAHIALGAPGVCTPDEIPRERRDQDARVERYCNEVAAEILVPTGALIEHAARRSGGNRDWTREELEELRRTYSASYQTILLRLLEIGELAPKQYERWQQAYRLGPSEGGFLSWPARYLRDNGRRFASLVLRAYANELVTGPEASRLLGNIKMEHLPEIRSKIQ